MALSVNRLINVSLDITRAAAASRGFGTLLLIGDSDVISGAERYRKYVDINSVAGDFGVDSEEYKAAALYYSQSPAPTNLMVARWNKVAAPAELRGAIFTDAERKLSPWNAVKDGTFAYRINNKVVPIEGLNFEGQTNFNGIADVINGKVSDIKVQWDGERFVVKTLATGAEQSLGYFESTAPQTNVHEMLGLSTGLATLVSGTDLIPGTPEIPAKPGILKGTEGADLEALKAITEGSFKVTINDKEYSLTHLDFSGANSFDDVALVVSKALELQAKGTGSCAYEEGRFVIYTTAKGAACSVGNVQSGEVTTPHKDATSGYLTGGDVSSKLEAFKKITDGSMSLTIDGTVYDIYDIDLHTCTTMDEMAKALTERLYSKATAVYDGDHFVVTSNSTGAKSSITDAAAGIAAVTRAGTFTGAPIADEATTLAEFKKLTAANIKTQVDTATTATEYTGINLSSVTNMAGVASAVQTKFSNATVTYDATKKCFVFTSKTTGNDSKVIVTAGSDATLFELMQLQEGVMKPGRAVTSSGINANMHTELALADGISTPGTDEVMQNATDLDTKLCLVDGAASRGKDLIPEVLEIKATPGKLIGGKHADLTKIKGIGDALFTITIDNGIEQTLDGLDFSGISTLEDVAKVINTQLTGASAAVIGDAIVVTSESTGASSIVSYAGAAKLDEKDISAMLKLTKSTALEPVPGFDAESPLQAVQIMCDKSADWYGCTFAVADMPSDDQLLDVAKFIEAQSDTTRIFGITAVDTRVLDKEYTDDIASRCKAAGLNRTTVQYSQNPYAICSFFGRAFTVNFNGSMTTITMMYKAEPSVNAEDLTETQAQTLEDKRCNVFVKYNNDTSIIQNGVTSGERWFDEQHGADWLKDYVQTAVFNRVYTTTTKIGQDDAGVNTIIAVINDALAQARENGFIGAGEWSGEGFGQLSHGDTMPSGYYVYAAPMSTQSASERAQRISVPIQVAAKLLGALHKFDVSITLDR